MSAKTFNLTTDHLTLLDNANWRWEDCEYGAPAIDCKRPYGNSCGVEHDIIELLGWDAHQERRAADIHHELLTALEVIFSSRAMVPGLYQRIGDKWRAVDVTP